MVVKSTVPIGTNDKVDQFIKDFLPHNGDFCNDNAEDNISKIRVEVASNPEFLAQETAVYDTLHASRIIIGTESK